MRKKLRPPIISVLIFTKDSQRFVEECLDSVFSQSIIQNCEIVVIDGNSMDDTVKKIKFLKKKAPCPLYVIRRRGEFSLFNSDYINVALTKASGSYVAFLDGDDVWIDSDKLLKQVTCFESNLKTNPYLGLVATKCEVFDYATKQQIGYSPEIRRLGRQSPVNLSFDNFVVFSTALAKRESIKVNIDYSRFPIKDLPIWSLLAAGTEMEILSDVTTRYQINHGMNLSKKGTKETQLLRKIITKSYISLESNENAAWLFSIYNDLVGYTNENSLEYEKWRNHDENFR